MPSPKTGTHLDEIYVDAYYTPEKGPVEMYNMFRIDYEEAKGRFKDEWFLEPPPGSEVVDKSPQKMVVEAAPDPLPLTTVQVKNKIRTGVVGSP